MGGPQLWSCMLGDGSKCTLCIHTPLLCQGQSLFAGHLCLLHVQPVKVCSNVENGFAETKYLDAKCLI